MVDEVIFVFLHFFHLFLSIAVDDFPFIELNIFSFPLEEFIYNYLITLSFYIIPKKGV